ncbi:11-S seed storage protein, conserved site-containing protein [Cynara cardunculus var. scolymus]|uniref:11-S seed storage protein, conserved site-containing protein n=1 Tax=Cynara cardunculus var. scolymus TaxID=59895 RepID=A0A103XP53_CYNCS|nr:11-S seed storage protein, conserved site-containing protein [Cynara cardunculus var. scolymus]
MANHLLLSLSFAFLIGSCLAFQPFQQQQNECQIQRINALEPNERVEAEGGWTEFFDANDQQFRCAGVEVIRHHIKPQGLLLPSYINTPLMVYIKQGIVLPGCPETFQSSQQLQERSQQSFQDRHQKIRTFRQGDLIVIPTGAAHWMYNDGQEDIVAIRFFLAGNPKEASQQQQQGRSWGRPSQKWQSPEESSADIFRGFDLQILSDAFNVDHETAQKLQSPGDNRGHIVTVQKGLQVIKPPVSRQEQERGNANGFEETICSAKLTSNIDDPSRADFYNPQAGRCTQLNSYKFPILQWVVNNQGQSVFNEQVREGQLVVVPQNFAVAKQAGQEGCKWISFRTNDNAMINTLAGHNSAIRAMPVDVIANSYQMSKEQASNLKFNRKETVMFNPRSQSWGWSAAA